MGGVFVSKAFTGEADLWRMRRLVAEAYATGAPGCWHVGDLTWRYFLFSIRSDPARDSLLWETGAGRLAGFGWIDMHNDSLDWQIRPEARWQGLEEQFFDWLEGEHAAQAGRQGRPMYAGALDDDPARTEFLTKRGFRRESGSVLQRRTLAGPLPQAALPPGYALRGAGGPHDAPRRAAAHRQAFPHSRVDDASYARLMTLPGYDPNLDVMAVAPGGDVAAYAMAWVDEANKVGLFEPVGTAPAHRRLGLGRVVLCEGLKRMKAAGAETAIVGALEDSRPARGLYESVGFEVFTTESEYERPA